MELGLVGLGKMGGNMRERIRRAGHTVIGYDRNPDLADVHSLEELVGKLKGPRVVWVMVPAGAATQSTIDELAELLSPGDVVVDGGNSRWTDDEKHAERARRQGHRLRRLRCLRRRLGPGERLRADVRRRRRARRQGPAGLRRAQARGRLRLGARRQGRRRPLRQDGPQRHRVRHDAGLCRGLGAAGEGRLGHRRPRGLPLLAGGHGHPLLAAGPGGPRAGRGRAPGEAARLRGGLRRGPLDGGGGDRQRGAAARDHRLALRPLRLPPGRTRRR